MKVAPATFDRAMPAGPVTTPILKSSGVWCVHKGEGYLPYTLSHVPTGYRVMMFRVRKDAYALLDALGAAHPTYAQGGTSMNLGGSADTSAVASTVVAWRDARKLEHDDYE